MCVCMYACMRMYRMTYLGGYYVHERAHVAKRTSVRASTSDDALFMTATPAWAAMVAGTRVLTSVRAGRLNNWTN